jgi:hypothetical protein
MSFTMGGAATTPGFSFDWFQSTGGVDPRLRVRRTRWKLATGEPRAVRFVGANMPAGRHVGAKEPRRHWRKPLPRLQVWREGARRAAGWRLCSLPDRDRDRDRRRSPLPDRGRSQRVALAGPTAGRRGRRRRSPPRPFALREPGYPSGDSFRAKYASDIG